LNQEEIGYIAVQKKPAITVFPDSVVVTNKRIMVCKPKNLGLSIEVIDHDWKDISGVFIKENILGTDFSFSTHTNVGLTVDYLPKNQARKLYTYAKEQLDLLKNPKATPSVVEEIKTETPIETPDSADAADGIVE
jgi:phage terminase large subunit